MKQRAKNEGTGPGRWAPRAEGRAPGPSAGGDRPVGPPRLCPVGTALRMQGPWAGSWAGTGGTGGRRGWPRFPGGMGSRGDSGRRDHRAHTRAKNHGVGVGGQGREPSGSRDAEQEGLRPETPRDPRRQVFTGRENGVEAAMRDTEVPAASGHGLRVPRAPPAPAPRLDAHDQSRPRPASTRGTTRPHPGSVLRGQACHPHVHRARELVHGASRRWGSSPRCCGPSTHPEGLPRGPRPASPGACVSAL